MRITFEANTLTASEEDRLITGVLIPYGEQGNSNLGMFSVPRGAFELPADPTQITVNVEHAREAVFGHGVRLTDSPTGVLFAARAANTAEGDKALADVKAGKLGFFSAEVAEVDVKDGQAVAGRLFGAALVKKPAFPSATLLAAAFEDEDGNSEITVTDEDAEPSEDATTTTEKYSDEITDEDGNTTLRETTITTVEDGNTTTITTETVVVEPEEDPTEEEEESLVSTLTASARKGATRLAARTKERPAAPAHHLPTLFAAMSAVKTGMATPEQHTLLASLTQLKTDGSLGPAAGGGSNKGLPDNWLGPLWDGRAYDRKYIGLMTLGTAISAQRKRGYKITRGTKAAPKDRLDGDWAGNLTEVKSGTAHITEYGSTLHKWALANELAREFFDLPGGEEFIEAYFKLLVEDYAMWSDLKALSVIAESAGAPVAALPRSARYQGGKGLGMLIQGITTVNRRRDTATFAIVTQNVMDELLDTPKDLIPEYVTFEFNTEMRGTADGGKVVVVEADEADFVKANGDPVLEAGSLGVLVGAKRAIEFEEVGETPIKVDALEVAKGGIDRGLFAYLDSFVVRTDSLALIADEPAIEEEEPETPPEG